MAGKSYSHAVDVWSVGIIFFLLLRGGLPFDGKTKEDVVNRTLTMKVSFRHPRWKHVSPQAMRLIKRFLEKDPSKRITMEEAARDRWFEPLAQHQSMMRARRSSRKAAGIAAAARAAAAAEEDELRKSLAGI